MITISRTDKSDFLDKLVEGIDKKAFGISRLSDGYGKIDPFEDKVDGEVWKIAGKKLYKKKRRSK